MQYAQLLTVAFMGFVALAAASPALQQDICLRICHPIEIECPHGWVCHILYIILILYYLLCYIVFEIY